MSAQELQKLVEKIVSRVMQQIESDADLLRLIASQRAGKTSASGKTPAAHSELPSPSIKKLYTERDILEWAKSGGKALVVPKTTIFTPSALDAAKHKGIDIINE